MTLVADLDAVAAGHLATLELASYAIKHRLIHMRSSSTLESARQIGLNALVHLSHTLRFNSVHRRLDQVQSGLHVMHQSAQIKAILFHVRHDLIQTKLQMRVPLLQFVLEFGGQLAIFG